MRPRFIQSEVLSGADPNVIQILFTPAFQSQVLLLIYGCDQSAQCLPVPLLNMFSARFTRIMHNDNVNVHEAYNLHEANKLLML